jgi:hypothetical protein
MMDNYCIFWFSFHRDDKCPSCRVVAKRRTLIPIYIVAYETSDSLLKKKETLSGEIEALKQKVKLQEDSYEALQVKLETINYYFWLTLVTLGGVGIWSWFMFLGS